MSNITLLKEADMVLSPCGRPMPPPGVRWVDLPYGIPFRAQIPQCALISLSGSSSLEVCPATTLPVNTVVQVNITAPQQGIGSEAFSITVTGNTISIILATNGGGTITTQGADVVAAVAGNAAAAALVTVTLKGTNTTAPTGTATVIAGVNVGIGTSASRIENKARVPFLCRGVAVYGIDDQVAFRIWWPNGRNLEQLLSPFNFAQSGSGMRTLMPEVLIESDGKITIELQNLPLASLTVNETETIYFKLTAITAGQASNNISFTVTGQGTPNLPLTVSVSGDNITVQLATDGAGTSTTTRDQMVAALMANPAVTALVSITPIGSSTLFVFNYPQQFLFAAGGGVIRMYFWGVLRYLLKADGSEPSPYLPDISRSPRIPGTSNQNIMAPELRLGNQCCPETPPGYVDEPYTLYSIPIANPVGSTTIGVPVEVPNDCDFFVIRNVQNDQVDDDTVTSGVAAIQIRLPSGYSLTNGDYLPDDWNGPVFPLMAVSGGGRLILDVADMDATGTGNITSTLQFDGVKRRKVLQ